MCPYSVLSGVELKPSHFLGLNRLEIIWQEVIQHSWRLAFAVGCLGFGWSLVTSPGNSDNLSGVEQTIENGAGGGDPPAADARQKLGTE